MHSKEVELHNVYLGLPQQLRITENAIYFMDCKVNKMVPFFPETCIMLNKNNSLTIQNKKLLKYNFLFQGNHLPEIHKFIYSILKNNLIYKENIISSLNKGCEAIFIDCKEQRRKVCVKFYTLSNHFEIFDLLSNKPIIKQTVSNISSLFYKINNNREFSITIKIKDKYYILLFENFELTRMIFMALLFLCLGSTNKYFYSSHYSKISLLFTRLFSLFKSYLLKNKKCNPFKSVLDSFIYNSAYDKNASNSISPEVKKGTINLDLPNEISDKQGKFSPLDQIKDQANPLGKESRIQANRNNIRLKELYNESFANGNNENMNRKENPWDSLVNYECFISTEIIRKSESSGSNHSGNNDELITNNVSILENDFETSYAKEEKEKDKDKDKDKDASILKKKNFINKNLKHVQKAEEEDKLIYDEMIKSDKKYSIQETKVIKDTINEVTKVLKSKHSSYINFLQEELNQMKIKMSNKKEKIHCLKLIVKDNENQKKKFDEILKVNTHLGNKK